MEINREENIYLFDSGRIIIYNQLKSIAGVLN
jgi:hypothetical protein